MLFWNKLIEYKEIPEKIPEFPEIWHKSPEIPELSKWLGIAISIYNYILCNKKDSCRLQLHKNYEWIEIHMTNIRLPTLSYHSNCYNFSLAFLTTYGKFYRARPGRILGFTIYAILCQTPSQS